MQLKNSGYFDIHPLEARFLFMILLNAKSNNNAYYYMYNQQILYIK